ncbi:unnamed protein product [Ascophyllum nodosum]
MDNWCEYISENGEVKHVLQLFCECEDLDETITELLSQSAETRDEGDSVRRVGSRWRRVLDAIQDRARLPWPGGAKRVDLGWFVAAFLLELLRWQIRRSKTLVAVGLSLAAGFGGLAYSHVQTLKQRSRWQFHVAWLTFSILQSYRQYKTKIRRHLPPAVDAVAHLALLSMLACYLHCCVADPGRHEVADASVPGAIDAIAAESTARLRAHEGLGRSEALRSGRCAICRCTFRLRDHHCVWVGQCVAERNRRSFLLFLVLLAVLSLWFASNMLALATGEDDTCQGDAAGQVLVAEGWTSSQGGVVLCVLLRNVGGEGVGYALYAFVAGVLAAALAAQQCLLVSAGVTSLELRRNRAPGQGDKPRSSDELGQLPSYPRDPHGNVRTPRRRVIFLPRASEFFGNWTRFLSGTELPRRPLDLSPTNRSRPTVDESNRRRNSSRGKLS